MITESVKAAIAEEARKAYPEECCGYVVLNATGVEEVYPCHNEHEHPKEHFKISEIDTQCAIRRGKIVAVYHSHPDVSAQPSPLDRSCCSTMDIPWIIYSYPQMGWHELKPEEIILPYAGREFLWRFQDCYTLLRDWFWQEHKIKLTDFEREPEFWSKGQNLYLDNFAAEGFVEVTDSEIRVGDVFLHLLKSKTIPNHASIYVGQGQILHHVYGRLSVIEPLTGLWAKTIHSRYRHRTLC